MPYPAEATTDTLKVNYFTGGGKVDTVEMFKDFFRLNVNPRHFNTAIGSGLRAAAQAYFESPQSDHILQNLELREAAKQRFLDPANYTKMYDELAGKYALIRSGGTLQYVHGAQFESYANGIITPTAGKDIIEFLTAEAFRDLSDDFIQGFDPVGAAANLLSSDEILRRAEQSATENGDVFKDIVNPKRKDFSDLSAEEILNIRQCALITDLFDPNGWCQTQANFNYSDRIYPVYSDNSDETSTLFVNKMTMVTDQNNIGSKSWFHSLEGGKTKSPTNLVQRLFYVTTDEKGELTQILLDLNKQQSSTINKSRASKLKKDLLQNQLARNLPFAEQQAKQRELADLNKEILNSSNNPDLGYYLEETKIKFIGTNISTARNDVEVTLQFKLNSLESLNASMSGINNLVLLKDLVTLPIDGDPGGGAGFLITNQYSPNYNRVRLTVQAGNDEKTPLVIDLTTIDHDLSRDTTTGLTTFTINYRGYFESMMNMPFNDAIADNDILNQREQRQKNIDLAMNTRDTNGKLVCDITTLKQILEVDREALRREKLLQNKFSFVERLFRRNKIYKVTYDLDKIQTYTNGTTLDPRRFPYVAINTTSPIQVPNVVSGAPLTPFQLLTGFGVQTSTGSAAIQAFAGGSVVGSLADISYFTTVGDIMEIATDCLYQTPGKADLREAVKNLNMRFIVGNIQIPNPVNSTGFLNVNPLNIPIDIAFFTQWYNDTVINKDLDYYPVGAFMRDLIERLVNSVIFDTCFALLAPDEQPPILRTSYFSNSEERFFKKNDKGLLDINDVYQDNNSRDILFIKNPKVFENRTNYCVVYQQNPSLFRQLTKAQGSWQTTAYVPTIVYGRKNTNHNYVSAVSLSKTTAPFLREARYFNNRFGNLSLLSNVYDLKFSIVDQKANTVLYPGMLFNFILKDWGELVPKNRVAAWDYGAGGGDFNDDSNPHNVKTLAYILGLGGYYIIKSVEYTIGQTDNDFKIDVSGVFHGIDPVKDPIKQQLGTIEKIEQNPTCAAIYNNHVRLTETIALPEDENTNLTFAATGGSLPTGPSVSTPPPQTIQQQINSRTQRISISGSISTQTGPAGAVNPIAPPGTQQAIVGIATNAVVGQNFTEALKTAYLGNPSDFQYGYQTQDANNNSLIVFTNGRELVVYDSNKFNNNPPSWFNANNLNMAQSAGSETAVEAAKAGFRDQYNIDTMILSTFSGTR